MASSSRRTFVKKLAVTFAGAAAAPLLLNGQPSASPARTVMPDSVGDARQYWINLAERIARPVLENLAARTLKANMPVEAHNPKSRAPFTYLEAFGRLLSGIAPWLEQDKPEKWVKLAHASIDAATDPASPDFMNFTNKPYNQPLVDASYLAMAFLRAPEVLWKSLDSRVKGNVITALKATRKIRPNQSNWLMFAATVEALMHMIGEEIVRPRVDNALRKHMEWYKGDGVYGDGPNFHWDYYNGFVIQPMLVEVTSIFAKDAEWGTFAPDVLKCAQRYSAILERFISPEGTYPPIGRSLTYRFGAFQPLAQMALMKKLPKNVSPAQVRCAMTTMIRRQMEAPGTFDEQGWLRIGFCGHQKGLADAYVSTGSLYLCANGLLALGLPASDPFWSAPDAPWTSVKAWAGVDIPGDHAI
ncbi:MAG: DUF2264 domain-containing protein [Puniceicoccales bacterium]|jgi:hypothetical protein|nr:DUF2264 domain-containing protein [Puniceicoccales bacterium]